MLRECILKFVSKQGLSFPVCNFGNYGILLIIKHTTDLNVSNYCLNFIIPDTRAQLVCVGINVSVIR